MAGAERHMAQCHRVDRYVTDGLSRTEAWARVHAEDGIEPRCIAASEETVRLSDRYKKVATTMVLSGRRHWRW